MIAVAVIDFETKTIPDRFSLGGAISGVVLSVTSSNAFEVLR